MDEANRAIPTNLACSFRYSLDLFQHFKRSSAVEKVAKIHDLDEMLLKRWVEVGLAIGHLEQKKRK
ncbi:hypothetical protein [Bacillus sp. JCM 19041]|uniref:hypothetical protein n=1 Tax=Bacillus sp. JCM 19041 TaxID=1460637 RepID=UPI0012E25755